MDKIQKLERLAAVARLYYEEDRNQSEIAGMFGISRPMVSKLLKEAKELGVVTIRIAVPGNGAPGETEDVLSRLRQRYGLLGGELVQDRGGDVATNQAVAEAGIAPGRKRAETVRHRLGTYHRGAGGPDREAQPAGEPGGEHLPADWKWGRRP